MPSVPWCKRGSGKAGPIGVKLRRDDMITVARMASVLRSVFEKEAPFLARQMGVIQRERKLNGTTLLLLFVLGWLHQPKAGRSRAGTICWHVGGDDQQARH